MQSTSKAPPVDAHPFVSVAQAHWSGSQHPPAITRANAQVIKQELWDPLEQDGFSISALAILEQLQALESYLWPSYNQKSSVQHVLLIALRIAAKSRQKLPTWQLLQDRPDDFSRLFRRLLALGLDGSLSLAVRAQLLITLIHAFGSLDQAIVRKECAPLVSIAIWEHLKSSDARQHLLDKHQPFKKAWRAASKRFDSGDESVKARIRFDRSWLAQMLIGFTNILHGDEPYDQASLLYCQRFVELLIDLQSQFPTRRYVNTLLHDYNLLVLITTSRIYHQRQNQLFRDLTKLLTHYTLFPLDDSTGRQLSPAEHASSQREKIARLQRSALKTSKDKLQLLALSNYGSLRQRAELKNHLDALEDSELIELAKALGFRTAYSKSVHLQVRRSLIEEVLVNFYTQQYDLSDHITDTTILPTEKSLYDPMMLRCESYDGSEPLAVPKLGLQYLSVTDFLWRSFVLFRQESYYAIRKDLEETLKRVHAKQDSGTGFTRIHGSSRMALSINKPAIVDIVPAKVGDNVPAEVRAEIILDVSRLPDALRRDWDDLKPGDIVFLVALAPVENQVRTGAPDTGPYRVPPFKHLRAAEVSQILDERSKPLRRQVDSNANGFSRRPRERRLIVRLDSTAYQNDKDSSMDVYDSINLVVRRRGRENNFKPMLSSIRDLILSGAALPAWLQDVFLGLGDPSSASYKSLPNALQALDFRDTFVDWQHLRDSLPGVHLESSGKVQSPGPPFVLEAATASDGTTSSSKKRRRDEDISGTEVVKVSSYHAPNMGPYPADKPRMNSIRFTPSQVDAIKSGTQPGLSIVVGPPGTGKTDVATQIISNIYHNYPDQRTLLIAHSNQALNQLFQKIVLHDIDERHLLRLGHGEGELHLEKDSSFSKAGRVESLLARASQLLGDVNRLAASIAAPGAHGSSCETAEYFNTVYIKPAWTNYLAAFQSDETSTEELMDRFPFHNYFYNTPEPLFQPDSDRAAILEVVTGCQRHIDKIFSELEDIRPFEVLRSARDRANYLLVKEAKIIAMTSTHAAIHRQEIFDLGFQYNNVVMEEAAQITEIENFIPFVLQESSDDTSSSLQRIVMCGDHLQNSPVIQSLALKQFANLDQNLFSRFVKLGVPTIQLDHQGRARPTIANLYRWRYQDLHHLPVVQQSTEFLNANPGLRYEYQFINVGDYKGKGESEPSPHFLQNLGEAEYAVALFMYMRLLGYPASKISILTTYAGQRALIRDVIAHRCAKNRLFGYPRIVATVDQYQGEQNDYVILSLVRTKTVGYLRDLRRLTVALSRARLGLYVLGRRSVFENSAELGPAFTQMFDRPDKLALVVGEMMPRTDRLLDVEPSNTSEMDGVEHLGAYVFQMTQAKVANLRAGEEKLAADAGGVINLDDDDEEFDVDEDGADLDADGVGDEHMNDEALDDGDDAGDPLDGQVDPSSGLY